MEAFLLTKNLFTKILTAKSEIFFISDDQYFLPNANPLDMAQFYRNYYSGFDMARFLE